LPRRSSGSVDTKAIRKRLTRGGLKLENCDYLHSVGVLTNGRKYVALSQKKTHRAKWRNPHELVFLGANAPERHSRSFEGLDRRHRSSTPTHALLHELRCFFDASYRLHQVRMATKATMRELDLGCVQLFERYDTDGSGRIDRAELGQAISTLGLVIRASEVDAVMAETDKDGGGDVDTDEFAAWLFAPSQDPRLDAKRRYDERDPCNDKELLRRDMARFDPMVRKLLEGFWQVCDRDKSGAINLEEYLFLHLNLYAAMHVEATQTEGWEAEATKIATREWEFDAQGRGSLDRNLFAISFFQLVDAWLVGEPSVDAYVKFLCFLMDRITVQDAPDREAQAAYERGADLVPPRRRVRLRWEADANWLATLEPLADVLPTDCIDEHVPAMERRLARGADKAIHAVPGLLEAVHAMELVLDKPLDALRATRLDVASDDESVASGAGPAMQLLRDKSVVSRVSTPSSSSDEEAEPEPVPRVRIDGREPVALDEAFDALARKKDAWRAREAAKEERRRQRKAEKEARRLEKATAKAEQKHLRAEEFNAQWKQQRAEEASAAAEASVAAEQLDDWEMKLEGQKRKAKEEKRCLKEEALDRKRLKQQQRKILERKTALEAAERRQRREDAAAAQIADAKANDDAAKAKHVAEELAKAHSASQDAADQEARASLAQQREEDELEAREAKAQARAAKKARKAAARKLEQGALDAAKAERKLKRDRARLEAEVTGLDVGHFDEEEDAWARAREEDGRCLKAEAQDAKRAAREERRRARALERDFDGGPLAAAAAAREARRAAQDGERRAREAEAARRDAAERAARRQERVEAARVQIAAAKSAGDAQAAEALAAELARADRASLEFEREGLEREELRARQEDAWRLKAIKKQWRLDQKLESAAARDEDREITAARQRAEREAEAASRRADGAAIAQRRIAAAADAEEVERIKDEVARNEAAARAELACANLAAREDLERKARVARELLDEEAAGAQRELREMREAARRALLEASSEKRLRRKAEAKAQVEAARLVGDAKAAENIAKELAAANRRSREELEKSTRAAAESEAREKAAEARVLRRAAREEEKASRRALRLAKGDAIRTRAEAAAADQQRATDDAAARRRVQEDEAAERKRAREAEARSRIEEARAAGDAAAAKRVANQLAEANRAAAEALARADRVSRERTYELALSDSSDSSDSSDGEVATTAPAAMFGLVRAKGALNRRVTKNRKMGDAVGRTGASVFGGPPREAPKKAAAFYRERARD